MNLKSSMNWNSLILMILVQPMIGPEEISILEMLILHSQMNQKPIDQSYLNSETDSSLQTSSGFRVESQLKFSGFNLSISSNNSCRNICLFLTLPFSLQSPSTKNIMILFSSFGQPKSLLQPATSIPSSLVFTSIEVVSLSLMKYLVFSIAMVSIKTKTTSKLLMVTSLSVKDYQQCCKNSLGIAGQSSQYMTLVNPGDSIRLQVKKK